MRSWPQRGVPALARLWVWVMAAQLAACESDGGKYYGTTRPKHGPDELWYNLFSEPEFLDPGLASDSASGTVITNLFAGLTQLHPTTLAPMPDVARSWRVEDGGKRYVFTLRPSTWSDGTPVTAHDFAFSWRRVLDPKTASKYASFLYPLQYAEEAHRGALMVRGVPAGTEESTVRAWLGDIEADKVRMAPELSAAFVHLSTPEGASRDAHFAQVVRALGERPLGGVGGIGGVGGARVRLEKATTAVIGVRALSDLTLEVRLNYPVPYFLAITSFYTAKPVPRHLFERLAGAGVEPSLWTRTEHIVSNGPYTLSDRKFRQYMVLTQNPRYWDAEQVSMERVRLLMVDSTNTALSLYKAGELDHLGEGSPPSEFLAQLSRYGDFERHPYLGTYFLWLNTAEPPLDDPDVREALSLAIDRKGLVDYVLRGGQIPTRDLVPAGLAGYDAVGRDIFDPKAAKALLAKAGYGPDRPLPPIVYRYNTSEGHKQVAEAIQQMWKRHLGVRVTLENEEWKVYLKHLNQMDFQVARMGWIGDYADPYTFLELLTEDNGNNHSNWRNRGYDELLDRANRTRAQERLALMRQAETVMLAANPIIPLYTYTRTRLVKPYVRGGFANYQNVTQFKYMAIDERFYDGVPAEVSPLAPPPVPQTAPAPVPGADAGGAAVGGAPGGPVRAPTTDAGQRDGATPVTRGER